MKQLAIIGATATGKSDSAIELALKHNADILSIDSLSIYKEIDIASAKPSKDELSSVKHHGVDILFPNEEFDVTMYIEIYNKLKQKLELEGKNLIIVGGSSFYLKTLLDGVSKLPKITQEDKLKVKELLDNLPKAYELLQKVDPQRASKITPNDKYRIEKALLIYIASGISAGKWFKENPPKKIIKDISIINIDTPKPILDERIKLRTKKMDSMGLIDEIAFLEHKYGRNHISMKAIGVVEVLEYFDGKVNKNEMLKLIATHTSQLAKRQKTFNRNQFKDILHLQLQDIQKAGDKIFT